jgi:hypothetical protein
MIDCWQDRSMLAGWKWFRVVQKHCLNVPKLVRDRWLIYSSLKLGNAVETLYKMSRHWIAVGQVAFVISIGFLLKVLVGTLDDVSEPLQTV